MENTNVKRGILKRLLGGQIEPQEAATQLQGQQGAILLIISTPDGLYTIGGEKGLTPEQMQARAKGKVHIILDEESALLGNA